MATRIKTHTIGKRTLAVSHALCDDCGREDAAAHQGRVTAPLPFGWQYREQPSRSGGSVQMIYSCCQLAKAA